MSSYIWRFLSKKTAAELVCNSDDNLFENVQNNENHDLQCRTTSRTFNRRLL